MAFPDLRRSLACAAVAATLGVASTAVQAVVYRGVFDPPDFEGVATFDVSQACLDAGPGTVDPVTFGCEVTWLTATVTFKDPTPENNITFDYHPEFLPSSSVIEDIFVEEGELAGVNSSAIGPVFISGHVNPDFNGPWWIEFLFTPPEIGLPSFDADASSGEFGFGIVNLYSGNCEPTDIGGPICVRNGEPSSVADVEGFERLAAVPEPGTLGLLAATLAGAWLARRRKAA